MSPEQLLAWATHLFDRQERRRKGEKIEVLAFYPVQRGKGKAAIPANLSVDEYIRNLPHMLARQEESGASGGGRDKRPYVPGEEPRDGVEKAVELNDNVLFEAESPGSVGGMWKDRVSFLRKLCQDTQYVKLLAWLDKVQVCVWSDHVDLAV